MKLRYFAKILTLILTLNACTSISVPPQFSYQEIPTADFTLASWQKITDTRAPYKIYIEGDGNSFDMNGQPTANPTPRGTLLREIAFGDPHANVIYLARPCQYVMRGICSERHWTTARFAPEIINAEYSAVRQIAGNSPITLVGFSGGAQIAGLISSAKQGLNVQKVITIAGNLDHLAWTNYHDLPSLNESMNLQNYRSEFLKLNQIHYAGQKDEVMPPHLIRDFIADDSLVIVVDDAEHNKGWNTVFKAIRDE